MNYPFRCKTCGVEFTVQMSVKQYETINVAYCPVCRSKEIKRTFHSSGISIHYSDEGFTLHTGEPNDITPRTN